MTIPCFLRPVPLLGLLSALVLIPVRGTQAAPSCSSCPGDLNNNNQVTVDEILTVVDAALTGCPAGEPSLSSLLQTGQSECDEGSGTLAACPGSPPGQDGAVAAGVSLTYRDNGDGTISDTATGLMWEKLSQGDASVHDSAATYTWYQAFSTKIATLNTAPCFADHCDWRLPNRRELESLVDAGATHPSIDQAFNSGCVIPGPTCTVATCSCTQLDHYWSSTTYEDGTSLAWSVNFDVGDVNGFDKSIPIYYVRAVRGGL